MQKFPWGKFSILFEMVYRLCGKGNALAASAKHNINAARALPLPRKCYVLPLPYHLFGEPHRLDHIALAGVSSAEKTVVLAAEELLVRNGDFAPRFSTAAADSGLCCKAWVVLR